jgi:hypothetical protein
MDQCYCLVIGHISLYLDILVLILLCDFDEVLCVFDPLSCLYSNILLPLRRIVFSDNY